MNVRTIVAVDDYERYVIAKYYAGSLDDAVASRIVGAKPIPRSRATRAQVRRFVAAAVRTAVREQASMFRDKRQRTVAARLERPIVDDVADRRELLPAPQEKQLSLL